MARTNLLFLLVFFIPFTYHAEGIWDYVPFAGNTKKNKNFIDLAKEQCHQELKEKLKDEMVGSIPPEVYKIYKYLTTQENTQTNPPSNKYLLHGPPGTGKTTITAALARATNAKYKNIVSSTLVTPFQGSASRTIEHEITKWVQEAEAEKRKTIIFFDEIDAIAGTSQEKHHREEEYHATQTLWSLCDKYEKNPWVVFIFATNKKENLTQAFQSRLIGDAIEFSYPTKDDRKEIFEFWNKKSNLNLSAELIDVCATKADGVSARFITKFMEELAWFKTAHPEVELSRTEMLDVLIHKASEEKKSQSNKDNSSNNYNGVIATGAIMGGVGGLMVGIGSVYTAFIKPKATGAQG